MSEPELSLISPFQSHYYQAIYNEDGTDADVEMETPLNLVDFSRVKVFSLFPLPNSPLQVALMIERPEGYRIIYRKEGLYSFQLDPEKPGSMKGSQGAYTYILGLIEDDGSEFMEKLEKGEIGSLKNVNWGGGFRIIMSPDGQLQAVGSVEVSELTRTINDKEVHFLHFKLKYIN